MLVKFYLHFTIFSLRPCSSCLDMEIPFYRQKLYLWQNRTCTDLFLIHAQFFCLRRKLNWLSVFDKSSLADSNSFIFECLQTIWFNYLLQYFSGSWNCAVWHSSSAPSFCFFKGWERNKFGTHYIFFINL